MQGNAALGDALAPIFASAAVQKLGLELSGDLSKLAGSYPQVGAFREARNCLDLKRLWVLFREHTSGVESPIRAGGKRGQIGLSSLSKILLGKPLDKTMQVRAEDSSLEHSPEHWGTLATGILSNAPGCPRIWSFLGQHLTHVT